MFAFVTLVTSDFYLPGALTLAAALKDVHSSSHLRIPFQTVCLTTPETVDVTSIKLLRRAFDIVIGVEIISQHDMRGLNLLGRPDLDTVLTKLHIFRLTQFKKIIYLDADVLPVRPLSHLFHIEHEFSAVPDVGWPDIFNSGVLVFSPSEENFQQLNGLLKTKGTWDGGDQGILNEWRGDNWNRLSFTYNTTPTASYTYAPAYERFGSKISAIHFIGPNKPWKEIPYRTPGVDTASQPSEPPPTNAQPHQSYDYASLVDRWFQVYDHHYRPPSHEPESEFRAPRYNAVWDENSPAHAEMSNIPSLGTQGPVPAGTFGLDELKRVAIQGMSSSAAPPADDHSGEGAYYSMPLEGRVDLMGPRTTENSVVAEALADSSQLTPTQKEPYRDRVTTPAAQHYFQPAGTHRGVDEPFMDHRWQQLQDERQREMQELQQREEHNFNQVPHAVEVKRATPSYPLGVQQQRRVEQEQRHEHQPHHSERRYHHPHPQRQQTSYHRRGEPQSHTPSQQQFLHTEPYYQHPLPSEPLHNQPTQPEPSYEQTSPRNAHRPSSYPDAHHPRSEPYTGQSFEHRGYSAEPQRQQLDHHHRRTEPRHQQLIKRHHRTEPQQLREQKQRFDTKGEQRVQQQYRKQSLQGRVPFPKHHGEENEQPLETPQQQKQGQLQHQHRVEGRPRSEHYTQPSQPSSSPIRSISFPNQRSAPSVLGPLPLERPAPSPRPSTPPLLLWNPAVEPPPTTPPGVSAFPTDTYFENVWDLPFGTKFEEHQYYDQGHSGPLLPSRSEALFEPPPTPQIPVELLRQGHYRNITGDDESPAPDPAKVKSLFPWETDPQHKHVPKRVFPDSDKPTAPEPVPEPLPAPSVHVASPTLGSPLQIRGSPVATPSIIQSIPTTLTYTNAWDVVPSIQKYASRLAQPAKPSPVLHSSEWRRSGGSWDDQSEGDSRDGDVEDEGEDSDQPSEVEAEPDDVEDEAPEMKAWRRQNFGKEKQYRVRGVQTIPRETREMGIQTNGIVKVLEPTRSVRLPTHAEAGVDPKVTTPPGEKIHSIPSGVQSPREFEYPQSPPSKQSAIPLPKLSVPSPIIRRERSGETASPPSSIGPVSPSEGQPIGLPGTSSQPLSQVESPVGSLSRKTGRVWDPARGVDVFKRNSEEVLARFLRMGSFDDDTGRS